MGWKKRGKVEQKEEVDGQLGGGKTPKDYSCHLLRDKNTSLEVWRVGGKTLWGIQEKLALSGTLSQGENRGGPLQWRFRVSSISSSSKSAPRMWNSFHRPVFMFSAARLTMLGPNLRCSLLLYVTLHSCPGPIRALNIVSSRHAVMFYSVLSIVCRAASVLLWFSVQTRERACKRRFS